MLIQMKKEIVLFLEIGSDGMSPIQRYKGLGEMDPETALGHYYEPRKSYSCKGYY